MHDPAKVLLDLALGLAIGGDCLADIAVLRAEPAVFGLVGSDPTVSRTIDRLADDATAVLAALDTARATARARAWELAGDQAPDHDTDAVNPLVIDADATLVTAHSDKEGAASTFKKGYGHHPLWTFVDHGPDGTGEPLAALLRPGNAGSNTACDHITVLRAALRQLPGHKPGNRAVRKVLIRIDGAGASHELLDWLTGQRLSYSVGFALTQAVVDELAALPEGDWQVAVDADGEPRPGAWVIEATGLMNLRGWPDGMRVIVRRERPHPGAQMRVTDPDGLRYTAFATNTRPGGPHRQLADLELRHRRRARRCNRQTLHTHLPSRAYAFADAGARTVYINPLLNLLLHESVTPRRADMRAQSHSLPRWRHTVTFRKFATALAAMLMMSAATIGTAEAASTATPAAPAGSCYIVLDKVKPGQQFSDVKSQGCGTETQSRTAAAAASVILLTLYQNTNYGGTSFTVYGAEGPCDALGYSLRDMTNINNVQVGGISSYKTFSDCNGQRIYNQTQLQGTPAGFQSYAVPSVGANFDNKVFSMKLFNIF